MFLSPRSNEQSELRDGPFVSVPMWDKARGRKQKDRPLREKARGRRPLAFFGNGSNKKTVRARLSLIL